VEKLTDVDGYDVDLRLEGHLVFLRYADRPGIVGAVGARLGDAGVNIAGAQVSRTRRGGEALMTLAVDNAVPGDVLDGIGEVIGARSVHSASLDPV
jgi:D-3-phosphoglycerate dehydrogenase